MKHIKNLNLVSISLAATLATFSASLSGCSKSAAPTLSSSQGPAIDAGSIPKGTSRVVTLANGADIVVRNLGGELFHEVEGTLSRDSFNALSAQLASMPKEERNGQIGREIGKVFSKVIVAKAIPMTEVDEVAYFTFLLPYKPELLSPLKGLHFDRELLLSPVTIDRDSLKEARAHTPAAEGLVPRLSARDSLKGFSGLERIHAVEFVKQAEADIGGGAQVNGSSVALGITDTGITLNHPTFLSKDKSHNRIEYLKDFTREGRIYFNPTAKLEIITPADGSPEDLTLNAQVIITPKLPDLPAADQFLDIKGLKIKVSAELKQILTTPGSGAKLGVLMEDSLDSEADPVDLNANGKSDDKLLVILVPGATPEQDALYFDPTGTGDFRKSAKLSDWNTSKSTMAVQAETIGFHIQNDKLPKADGSGALEVRSASIVGFDPGNHGSHVAGIAAGSKTIANDPDQETLARGVAPEARILLDRVCANNGGCNASEAMVDMAVNGGAEVINMSLGGLSPFNDGYGVQETLVNRLSSLKNTLFVISAGNSGPGHQTVGSPSTARLSLSVGATATQGMIQRQYEWPGAESLTDAEADQDLMLFFSSRGPTAAGGFKPNITAPGTELSSVQLNSAIGAHAGLDVYWGTSMAAPTATGGYALLLDAIKKYNLAHPEKKLTTNSLTLRDVLIDSARAFDVSTLDPVTGNKTSGRYTWVDQGKGMLDLTAAWKKLFELRDRPLPSAVLTRDGQSVDLDYQVIAPAKSLNGVSYDGTRAAATGSPALGTGVYLDYASTDTLKQVFIARRLPEALSSGPEAGLLNRQLESTQDEFVLKTLIYGSEFNWLKVGTLDQLNCANSPTANLVVLSRGVDVKVKDDSTGEVSAETASSLNICVNREMVTHELPQGDNGALISGYRVVNGKVAVLPSFTVPVYVTVPHKTLANSSGYQTTQTVRSFDVSRNYVTIPQGTSLVKITLEVPAIKRKADGLPYAEEECSGVELMALVGNNSTPAIKARKDARVFNCDATGGIVPADASGEAKRKLVFSTTKPLPGVWDIHVFGSYKYAKSKFTLTVDYVNAAPSISLIEGGLAALNGSLNWTVKESSLAVVPDSAKSSLELNGLLSETASKVAKDEHVIVPGAGGLALRKYPAEAKSITITTGGSKGNDIDLAIIECDAKATTADDASCKPAGASGGATDEESVTFKPKLDKLYAVRVDGFDIKDEGKFRSTETITLPTEKGTVAVSGQAPDFRLTYALSAGQQDASALLRSELFTSGKYVVTGALVIRTADETLLSAIPLKIIHSID